MSILERIVPSSNKLFQTQSKQPQSSQALPIENIESDSSKFGTFAGVFTPTLLTVLGAIMYLRTGWVVGNAGLLGAFAIILLANLITICTGLSISSIATNIRVRAGGAFSIISQSLGLEVGGSTSVLLYFAQAVSVTMYVLAFSEGWLRIFPSHPLFLVAFATFGLVFAIAYASASLAARAQFFIMAIVAISLVSIFLGALPIMGRTGMSHSPQLWGSFTDGNFWVIFAVFFPAVTGIMSGVSLSGDLKDPRDSIPKGTMSAIFVTLVIYLGLAYWLSGMATPDQLKSNLTIAVDQALWGPAVLAGILGATFSSALSSLVAAPRVMQALGSHGVLPAGDFLSAQTRNGEPRNAMLVTGTIAICALIFSLMGGGLNAIAPLITMFFLIMYAMLNAVVLIEQSLQLISFRPLFRIPRIVPMIGLAGCLFVMFLVNPILSLVAMGGTIGIYIYLLRKQLVAPWSDVRSSLFVMVAEWAANRVGEGLERAERAWSPNLLVPVESTSALTGSYRFLKTLTWPRGSLRTLGLYPPGHADKLMNVEDLMNAFEQEGIFARTTLVESEDFITGLRVGLDVLGGVLFRPNLLFLSVDPDSDEVELQTIIERASAHEMGVILYARHPITGSGREQTVNTWIRDQGPQWKPELHRSNLDLLLLLSYQISRNWHGHINLISVVDDEAEQDQADTFLNAIVDLGRMPKDTATIVDSGTVVDYISRAPRADINVFGMGQTIELAHIQQLVEKSRATCIFVRDSGRESAFA